MSVLANITPGRTSPIQWPNALQPLLKDISKPTGRERRLTSRRYNDRSLYGYASGRYRPIWEVHKLVTHPEEFHLTASMIPQEPKLLPTPLAEDGEGNLGGGSVTRKSIKKAHSPMRDERRTSPPPHQQTTVVGRPHQQTTVVGRPDRKVTRLELGSRTKELSR